ncbi:MAG: hypothetical protein ACE5I7_07060 [Candidatus Binatia bacterium]
MAAHHATAFVTAFVLFVRVSSTLAVSAAATISANVAGRFVGRQKIVEGTVAAARREGSVVRLHLGTAPRSLTVSLVIGLLSDFPARPEQYYLHRTVRVAGMIRSFRGTPEIVVHSVANIRVVGSAPAVAPRSSDLEEGVGNQQSVRERLDALNDRIRLLEERMERLEHLIQHEGDK